ncbi:acetolactate decarboxylase [Larkinella humicola]|uniref:Alpha-acetolactate decarboxylase n=1 Tax=Larkinella humicola TaxID=2607654 RepID=A0A5N1JPI8_9BACT|nr:acetolactate decarboxylase [Larkinella humicola]KAA9356529.1 acetolactate decarboxylase [Larkinella humicola]
MQTKPGVKRAFFYSIVSLTLLTGQSCTTKEDAQPDTRSTTDFLYQYSIITALLAGVFDGNLTFGELKKHGDFGVGTFNRVDGELVINEGKQYRIRSNGSVSEVADHDSTSLAFVKFFKADSSFTVQTAGMTLDQLQKMIAATLPINEIYAIRIKGTFSKLTTRAPAPAQKPYPTLNDHLAKSQVIFNLTNTTGVAVGFLVPTYMEKVNVPGFHFHFLADDRKSGGHVYDFTATQVTVEIDRTKGYYVELNTNTDFGKVTL